MTGSARPAPRHRRHVPRRPSRLSGGVTVAATTVLATAGVMAAPLAPAQAVSSNAVWNRIAACESSGRWHVNTHNHYYGGLQFWQPTWQDFGGVKYAPRADLATPAQQIEVARRVLAVQGPKAWPVCGKRAKLTKADGAATSAALPDIGPYLRSVPATRQTAAHATSARATSSSAGSAHGAEAIRAKPARVVPAKTVKPRIERYRVQPGDSLSALAQSYQVAGGWEALWRYNRTNVPNPNVIMIGQLLQIP